MKNELIEHDGNPYVPSIYEKDAVAEDIDDASQTYKTLIEKGGEALDIAFDILEGTEHPRAVETFSGLMKTISDVTSKMVDLQITKKELAGAGESKSPNDEKTSNTQNNFYVGTPAELQELLRNGDNE